MTEPLTINHIRSAMAVAKSDRLQPLVINGREVYLVFADEDRVRRYRFLARMYRLADWLRARMPVNAS